MTPEPSPGPDAPTPHWKRFNDECFSLHPPAASTPDDLISNLATEGVELILDARPENTADAVAMAAGCEKAGLYYVPAHDRGADLDLADDAVTRYTKLALRHKTCVVVDDNAEGLLRLIADQLPGDVVSLNNDLDATA